MDLDKLLFECQSQIIRLYLQRQEIDRLRNTVNSQIQQIEIELIKLDAQQALIEKLKLEN